MSYVGKIYPSVLQFYDVKTKSQRNKSRPVLIIAEPKIPSIQFYRYQPS